MKIKSLALLICATLASSTALANNNATSDMAYAGNTYTAVIVKMKAASSLSRQQLPALLNLNDPSLNVTAQFQHATARGAELSELQALDAKYGFDRYLRIAISQDKTRDIAYINRIINEVKENAHVEVVYPESGPVEPGVSTAAPKAAAATVADYRSLQYYTRAPDDIASPYKFGGVNRDSVSQYEGHDGSSVTVVSHEPGKWNQNHINLPQATFSIGTSSGNPDEEAHDTASAGVIAATDIGAGVKGLAWNTHLAFVGYGSGNLYNVIPKLQAGDVVQIGLQAYGGEVTGCISKCYVPIETSQDYFDVIKALTDKGVHVIEAAANGNLDLDHSGFGGRFNLQTRDSGAIIVGAADPLYGGRSYFSDYGSRITSDSWGRNVTTTGMSDLSAAQNAEYTDSFAGTSSANPIVAGVVASLSSIAKVHGKTVTPRQMRDILNQTGTAVAGNTTEIGTQPDMGRAVERILELNDNQTQNTDAAFINALKMAMQSTDNGSSVTFNGNVSSTSAATSTPTYSWKLPSGVQGSNSGTSSQSFTVNKTSQAQNLTVTVTVGAGSESRVLTQNITVPALATSENTDAAFINALQMAVQSTDNGDSVTFNGNVTSTSAATSTPTYSWTLPSGAQGSNSGKATQSFTINKTSQQQTLTVKVDVKAGTQSGQRTQTITVPALAVAGAYPTWDSNTAYTTGEKVSWNGGDFQAKWWTRGNEPGTSDAWESLNASQVAEWNSSMAYNGGDIVLFNGHTWKAKWWTKGNQPGTNDVWEQIS